MTVDAIAAAGAGVPVEQQIPTIQAGPNASIGDVTSFQGSMNAAGLGGVQGIGSDALGPAMKSMFTQLEKVNGEAKSVSEFASAASASGNNMTPGEVVQLTMKCHEFMFHCQLSSSIANRTSDGIQQLFRQQS
jgi:hypothetical protein